MKHSATTLRVLVSALLIVPWLNPFAPGPSPAVVPWLVAAFCIAGICFLCAAGKIWFPSVRFLEPSMVASTWLIAASLSAVIGICQYIGWASYFGQWVNQTHPGQAFGNLRQRNQFAGLLNLGLIGLLWFAPAKAAISGHLRFLIPACAVLLGIGNAVSASRTGLLQLLLVTALYWYWSPNFWSQRKGGLLCLAWAAYGAAAWGVPLLAGVEGGILSRGIGVGPACASRMVLWGNVVELVVQKPWFGWGWGELDYAHFITLYDKPRFCDILDNAHNLPLHLAVELGIPVSLSISSLAAWAAWHAAPWKETNPGRQMAWAAACVILVHSLLEYPLWYGPFQISFCLCLFLLGTYRQEQAPRLDFALRRQDGITKGSVGAHMIFLGTLIAIALEISAGLAYYRVSQIYRPFHERSPAYRQDTLNKIRGTLFFQDQARFAELGITALNSGNAVELHRLATELLHYSPEPRVIEKKIESATMLGLDEDALLDIARYRVAFPKDHAEWERSRPQY